MAVRMYPLAHLEGRLKTHRRKRFNYHLANITGFILLITTAVILSPLLHELLHMLFLDMNSMQYSTELNFDFENGIYGKLTPLSNLSVNGSIILLGIGIFGNLLLSAIFFLGSWGIRNVGRLPESIFSAYLAVGFFYHPLIYFFASEGDLMNILSLLDMAEFYYISPVIGFILFLLVSLYIHEHAKHAFFEYHRIGEEIEKLERFLGVRAAAGSRQRSRILCR